MPDAYPIFVALDATALEAGRIYIGAENTDPEMSPINVYWDEALTVLANQPLLTSGGVIVRDGTPAQVYASSQSYSIRVRDRSGAVVWYKPVTGGALASSRLSFPIPTGPASTVPGPSNNTRVDLATLKAANIADLTSLYNGSLWTWTLGNFTSQADNINIVKADSTALSVGAWVRAPKTAITPNIGAAANASFLLQAAIDSAFPGDVVLLPRSTYTCTVAPIIKPGVTLDLNGATLILNLSGENDYGVRLRSKARLLNGTIVVNSTGNPSFQTGAHSCVAIGPQYGSSPTIGSISPDEGVTDVQVSNLDLINNKLTTEGGVTVGGVCIAIMGGATNGLIEDIRTPDSDRLFGIVHADWGTVGPIDSGNIAASRVAFDAGTAYTTHPHGWTIRGIRAGRLTRLMQGTDTGSHGIRLSGVYNFSVSDVRVGATTFATVRHTGGDLGFEFASETDKRMAYQNIVIRDVSCPDTGPRGQLIYSDTLADNVQRAVQDNGYSAIVIPLALTNMVMERITGKAPAGVTSDGIGVRVIQQRGGSFVDCGSTGHHIGHLVGEQAVDVELVRPRATLCRMEGVFIGEASQTAPVRCTARGALPYFNNRAGMGRANVAIGRSVECTVNGGVIGLANSESAKFGIFVDTAANGCIDASIVGKPNIQGHAAGGAAISVSSDEGWRALRLFQGGATYGPGVTAQWVGLSIVPVALDTSGGAVRRVSKAVSAKLAAYTTPPASYPAQAGEVIEFNDPVITADTPPLYFARSVCYATGTPGTWHAST